MAGGRRRADPPALAAGARQPAPARTAASYTLPRRDRAAFEIEIELLLDWYWPAIKGGACATVVRAEFEALWTPVLDRLLALPGGWFLRDFHSPNLMWLPERQGIARVGIIDFQDALNEHAAFDLVSLLQDARVTVPEALEARAFRATTAPRSPGASPPSTPRHSPPPTPTSAHSATRGSSASGCG